MEPSGMFSALVGVENPHNLQPHPQMVPYPTHHDNDPQLQHQSIKHGYPNYSSSKTKQQQQSTLSDEDEPGGDEDPKRKVSPWQRMKWTDTMVRLLIMAVYYIGDEAASEGGDKKKPSGLMQKKGKWKSVSRAMMEKGFYVSPQQCEDKFNDLNKRYKRVNDILGKGTACRVVENQSLLDTMDLSPKMKEEVKKLLNSKHLFFREMCAYHNSCGHGNSSNVPQQGESGGEMSQSQSQAQPQPHQQQQQQQRCLHSSENMVGSLGGSGVDGLRMSKVGNGEEDDDDEDDEEEEDEDDSDEDEDDSGEGGSRGQVGHGHEDEDENDGRPMRKKARKVGEFSMSPLMMQQLNAEVSGVFQDGGKSAWDKKQWMRGRILQLEEQQLSYQTQAFELEKQRLKWVRFSSKKEREMERAKLENERRRLENERMVLLIRQKEIEWMNQQHQHQQQQHSST
ncbi:hypothetical protein Fmac_027529 [Flemingia macrophylla]|uniref:Myb/SANT-like DNA-binding domain-containing protein n=1 Tax=Flemingia macrophylla TaxID=520843 RepID=A0ABD1LJL4_9FABA